MPETWPDESKISAPAAGVTLALLGEPGAGQGELLRALAGAERAVLVADGMLQAGHSVAENIAAWLAPDGADTDRRIAAWLQLLGLSRVAALPPLQLSTEAVRRTALACALAASPRLLLLEEPFAGCEPVSRRLMAAALRRLQARLGLAVVLAIADAPEARSLADRVAVLRDGQVVQAGGMVAVYERPSSAYAARALGAVNFLPGRVEEVDDESALVRLAEGTLVEATLADAELGHDCLVAVRPERIAVVAVSREEMGAGAIAARVVTCVHHGDHVCLELSVAGTSVMVRRPPGPEALPGHDVSIAWQPAHAHACQR